MRLKRLLVTVLVLVTAAVASVAFLTRETDDEAASTRPGREPAAATQADNGGVVSVPVGKPFVVVLQGTAAEPWEVPWSTDVSMARVASSQELDGSATATFVPVEVTPGVPVVAQRAGPTGERFEVTVQVVG